MGHILFLGVRNFFENAEFCKNLILQVIERLGDVYIILVVKVFV